MTALKKAGIVDVDIAKAKPYWIRKAGPRGGTYTLSEIIDKYDDIVSGKASAVKLSPAKTTEYRKQGFEVTKQGRIIVPHSAVEKVKVKKGDYFTQDVKGIKRIPVSVPYHNLEQYLTDLRASEKELQKSRGKNRYFAFRFFGGHSSVYSHIDDALADLREYQTVVQAINSKSARDMNEVFRNLEIVETSSTAWHHSKDVARKAREKAYKRKHVEGRRRKALEGAKRRGGIATTEYRAKRAAQEKLRRDKMSPSQKELYRQKARKRAKK